MHAHTHHHGHEHEDAEHDHGAGPSGHELSHHPRKGHSRSTDRGRLWITLGLSVGTLIAEAVGGWVTHSLALLSDAGHMLTDVSAIVLSMLALWFGSRPADEKKSFGYYRLEILAALTNGVALIAISILIAWEAIARIRNPVEVHVGPMIWVAAGGFIANGLGAQLLSHSHNLNVRGVFLHMLGDLLASAGVLAAAVVMWFTGWYRADPLISIGVSLVILYGSYGLVREAVDVLLESVPAHLDTEAIEKAMAAVPRVKAVHDLHVWTIATGMYALSAHVVVERAACADSDEILRQLKAEVASKFHIDHTTLQIESEVYEHHGEADDDGHGHDHPGHEHA
ncbi:MAG: cation transporter [Deltaproteobacteria bacterium]|nr:cation transporter [Deltaproteobacteria bacterium]